MIHIVIKGNMDKRLPQIERALKRMGAKQASAIMRGAVQRAGTDLRKRMARAGALGTGLSMKDSRNRVFRFPKRQRREGWGKTTLLINEWSAIVPIARWNFRRMKNGDLKVRPKTATSARPKWKGRDRFAIKSKFQGKGRPEYVIRSKNSRGSEKTVHADADFAEVIKPRLHRFAVKALAVMRRDVERRLNKLAQKELGRFR